MLRESPNPTAARDILGLLVRGIVFLLPLACWPGFERPFSTPKIGLLFCLDLVLAAAWLRRKHEIPGQPAAAEWLALAWAGAVSTSALAAASVSLDALLLALLPLPLFRAFRQESLAVTVWLSSVAESAVAALQYCGLDPLRWLGWQPETFASPRMRVYGTMGNPDFVAAWCCATLPFCWHEFSRGGQSRPAKALRGAALALQVAAILATGSRVFALALPVQAAALALCRGRIRWKWLLALPAAAVLLYIAPARPLAATLQGRLYLAQVAASHWRQTPLAGYGPGAFEARFSQWQAEWLRGHAHDPRPARFAGAVDHAHNDYLEFLVDYGPLGLGVFLSLGGWVAGQAWSSRARQAAPAEAAAMGAATLLAVALVDFPFHRPAEWSLFWLFSGILYGTTKYERTRSNEKCRSQADV